MDWFAIFLPVVQYRSASRLTEQRPGTAELRCFVARPNRSTHSTPAEVKRNAEPPDQLSALNWPACTTLTSRLQTTEDSKQLDSWQSSDPDPWQQVDRVPGGIVFPLALH